MTHPRDVLRVLSLGLALAALAPHVAEAQYSDELRQRARRGSPENFAFQLSLGTYRPGLGSDAGDAHRTVFGGDRGPKVLLEMDGFVYRIPYVGLIGAGAAFSWVRYRANACDAEVGCNGTRLDERTELKIYGLSPMLVLRVDALARYFEIPFVVTGKLGTTFSIFDASDPNDGGPSSGYTAALRWAVQLAFELDVINRRRAAALDDSYGINHSTFFVELYGIGSPGDQINLGSSFSWTVGLGLTF